MPNINDSKSTTTCPNCGNEASVIVHTTKSDIVFELEHTTIRCPHCGLTITPRIDYMPLKELNQLRLDCDMEKIERTKRPPQNYDLWD